jgi:hypothetical protein
MESNMTTIIDLSSEVLIDRSHVRNPYLRLLLSALGQELTRGSPWVALNKRVALDYEPLLAIVGERLQHAAA